MVLKVIVGGIARGIVLKTLQPINFLGAVDGRTGVIRDSCHELYGRSVAGTILVFPHGVGSSVGAYTIYSLKAAGAAPRAMACKKADLAVASGCALAGIPLVTLSREEFDSLQDGITIDLGRDLQFPPRNGSPRLGLSEDRPLKG